MDRASPARRLPVVLFVARLATAAALAIAPAAATITAATGGRRPATWGRPAAETAAGRPAAETAAGRPAAETAAATRAAEATAAARGAITTRATLPLARLVDTQPATVDLATVERLDGGLSVGRGFHFDKRKAPRSSGLAISHHRHAPDGPPIFLEDGAQPVLRR